MHRPLSPALQEIWALVDGSVLAAKELATQVEGGPVSADSIRKRVASIRQLGRRIEVRRGLGYFRPDKPPPGSNGAEQESD